MGERESRTSFLTVLGDSVLLLCAMVGLTGAFLTLYGDPTALWMDAGLLDLCAAQMSNYFTVAVAFSFISLTIWSLPRFRWAAAGGGALLVGLFTWSSWDSAIQGAGLVVRAISAIFASRVSWGVEIRYDPGLTRTEELAAARVFLVLALAVLALVLGWAVIRARRWWVVAAFTLPPLLPGLLADLYPGWPPFMALAACWCVMLLTDLCKWAAPSNRGKLTLAMLPCVGLVLAVITLAFPREGYTRPPWALKMEEDLLNAADRLNSLFPDTDGPFKRTVTYVGSAEEADLAHAGPLNYTGRTVLRVRTDYVGRLYLRGSSLAVYENGVWEAMPDEVYEEYSSAASWTGIKTFPLFYPAIMARTVEEHTAVVDNVGAVGACVYAPYFLAVQDLEANDMTPVNDSLLARRQGRWTHTISFVEVNDPAPAGGESYVAAGSLPVEDVASGKADFGSYAGFVYEHYLDVPEEYEALFWDVMATYSWRPIPSDPVEAAGSLAEILKNLCEYDPEAPAPPEGADPVVYFLAESRRGYCMHFASAATLMLRSLGIPARYVSGFTAECAPDRATAVPDRAAHAWVEVWVNGFGWYPVEVTPAAAFSWYQSGVIEPEDLPSDILEESEEPEPTPTPTPTPEPGTEDAEGPSAAPAENDGPEEKQIDLTVLFAALKVLGITAGIFAVFWLGQYVPKKIRAKRLENPDRNRAALDGYGYMVRMERWGGRMDERVVELAQKARFSQHTLTREELDEMRGFVDRERERLCIVLGPVGRLVFRYFWGMPVLPKLGENAEDFPENGQ